MGEFGVGGRGRPGPRDRSVSVLYLAGAGVETGDAPAVQTAIVGGPYNFRTFYLVSPLYSKPWRQILVVMCHFLEML